MNRVLFVAPHPDDEVLGCGGTMKKLSEAGCEVHLCVVTKAYTPEWTEETIKNKVEEIKTSSAILGVEKIHSLGLPTVKLDTLPQKDLNGALAEVIKDSQPDTVYIPHRGDINKDHTLVHEATLVACRPSAHCPVKRILAYETLSETEWGNVPFWPTVYEEISDTLGAKIEAMRVYESELKQFPHPRSKEGMEVLARKRGSEVYTTAAEAFILIREQR